jgi:GT2 family glycosyltransferase
MPPDLAPIGVSTYSRLQHLQQTIAALQKNTLARQSEVYIFSDAPRPGDEDKVEAVRRYLRTIDGFKAIHIIERTENNRVMNNRGGIRMLLDQYGKLIFLEEDVVTAREFLAFMNQALATYRNNHKVFAISGYCPPIDADRYVQSDAFLLPSCNFWGFAIWKERFDRVRMKTPPYEVLKTIGNPFSLASYMGFGADIPLMFILDARGKIDAGDIKFSYEMWRSDSYMLVPRQSLSKNIGFDGSGEHCGLEQKYDIEMSDDSSGSFNLPEKPELIPELVAQYRKFRMRGIPPVYRLLIAIYFGLARFVRDKIKQKLVAMYAALSKHE